MKPFYRIQEAASIIGVSVSTLRSYANDGRIGFTRSPGGQRVFTQKDIDNFMGVTRQPQIMAFYVRSSDGDDKKMDEQIRRLISVYGDPIAVYKDKASGLNENRRGLKALLRDAQKSKFSSVAITERDRLTRFGFSYLEELLGRDGIHIEVMSDSRSSSLEEELMRDFMSLIASFSGKFYRLRGHEQKRRLLQEAGDRLEEDH